MGKKSLVESGVIWLLEVRLRRRSLAEAVLAGGPVGEQMTVEVLGFHVGEQEATQPNAAGTLKAQWHQGSAASRLTHMGTHTHTHTGTHSQLHFQVSVIKTIREHGGKEEKWPASSFRYRAMTYKVCLQI